MEKERNEYRGALAWMKNVSTVLDSYLIPFTSYFIIGEHRVGSRHISTAGEVQEGAGPCEDQQSKVEKQNKKFKHLLFPVWSCSLFFNISHNVSFGTLRLFLSIGKTNWCSHVYGDIITYQGLAGFYCL